MFNLDSNQGRDPGKGRVQDVPLKRQLTVGRYVPENRTVSQWLSDGSSPHRLDKSKQIFLSFCILLSVYKEASPWHAHSQISKDWDSWQCHLWCGKFAFSDLFCPVELVIVYRELWTAWTLLWQGGDSLSQGNMVWISRVYPGFENKTLEVHEGCL